VSILNLILSLEGGFYVLFVPSIGGDVSEWFKVIDNAGGKPSSGPGTFSSGVAFAYSAPDVSAFSTALKLIF